MREARWPARFREARRYANMNRPEAVPAMRVSGSGLVFAPSGLRSYIPTTRRRPFQVLPDGEAEVPSGKRSGEDRAAGAAGALHNSCRGAQPGMKKSGQQGRSCLGAGRCFGCGRGGHDSCRSTKPGVNPGRGIWSTEIQGRRVENENPGREAGRIKYMIAK